MRKVVLLFAVFLAGCQSGGVGGAPAAALVKHDLAEGNGRWLSTQKVIKTEWSFKSDGSYDALHEEGSMAAQIRGKYRWDNGLLVIDPDRDSIEARSRNKEEADRVQDRLSKGFVLTVVWDGNDKFTATPSDKGEALVFTKSQG